jgi:hypothetical protein
MAKIIINGETFDYDGTKQPTSEALWIEHVYQRRYGEWQEDLAAGSARALIMLACLVWRRDGRDVDTAFQDVLDGTTGFDLSEMLTSMAEAGETEAPDPTITGGSPDLAGSPTTGAGTRGSSPSTSTSARGKSGSSKSRTSKP